MAKDTKCSTDPWTGFVEASTGVNRNGFAIRGSASLRLPLRHVLGESELTCSIYRSTTEWRWVKLQIWINETCLGELGSKEVGHFEKRFVLPELTADYFALTFKVKPNRALHACASLFTTSRPSEDRTILARDALLVNKVNLGKTVLIDYSSAKSRFCPDLLSENVQTPVQVVGFYSQSFGLAEACRCTTKALEVAEISHTRTQLPFKGRHIGEDFSMKANSPSQISTEYEFRIFHCNGDYQNQIKQKWGRQIFDNSYSIGFWHWELPVFPEEFLPWFSCMNEIWTPSAFVHDAIAPKSPVPVQLVPLAIHESLFSPPATDRQKLGIPRDAFLFLTSFDFYSSIERKNPIGVIQAFFSLLEQGKEQIHLVIKTSNRHADLEAASNLEAALKKLPKDRFTHIVEALPRETMLCLMNSCNAFVSLHRSEGFGLHLAEAMAMGKAVIATNWSGNIDFMDDTNSYPVDYRLVELQENHGPYAKGNYWADPDIEHAIAQMSLVIEDEQSGNTSRREAARTTISERHSPRRIGSLIQSRLATVEHFRNLGQIR
jgi:glycosyltransferase involved in cell wall biosynthesis